MKKHLSILSIALLSAASLLSQPQYANLDTVTGKSRRLYSQEWYTDCRQYNNGEGRLTVETQPTTNGHVLTAVEYKVCGRMEVAGLAAMVATSVDFDTTYISQLFPLDRLPETLYLVQGLDAVPNTGLIFPREMQVVDSLRWDTVKPCLMRLPKVPSASADSDYMECYLYEAYFDKQIIVDSVFYVIGTTRSNKQELINLPPGSGPTAVMRYAHYPTVYPYVRDAENDLCGHCWSAGMARTFTTSNGVGAPPEMWRLANWQNDHLRLQSGPLFAIARMHRLRLNVSNPEAGSVEGGGDYPHLSTARATAVPALGYTFSHWSDGVTENPRMIEMDLDISLVAVFQ